MVTHSNHSQLAVLNGMEKSEDRFAPITLQRFLLFMREVGSKHKNALYAQNLYFELGGHFLPYEVTMQ